MGKARITCIDIYESLFWGVIRERRRSGKCTLEALADAIGRDKSAVSRWFSGEPNWELDTISDIAGALDLDIRIEARERSTDKRFAPEGFVPPSGAAPLKMSRGR
jgi:transcriptional regulator with XRE-family HTH domain